MIRIISIDRRIEIDKGGIASDAACKVVLAAGADVPLNKVRFLLTPDEAAKVDALTKEIEQRLGYLLAADYIAPEPVLADEEASAQTA